jgi:hypothetical protein
MELIPSPPDVQPGRRKPKLWDRVKRRNTSSPSIRGIGLKNWSTRSLPRLGSSSFSQASSSKSSPLSSLSCFPVEGKFDESEEILPSKEVVVQDFFSTLPHEIKVRILSYLPLEAIVRASVV